MLLQTQSEVNGIPLRAGRKIDSRQWPVVPGSCRLYTNDRIDHRSLRRLGRVGTCLLVAAMLSILS